MFFNDLNSNYSNGVQFSVKKKGVFVIYQFSASRATYIKFILINLSKVELQYNCK